MVFTAQQIADILQGEVQGDPATAVSTFTKIEEGTEGAISFLSNPRYTPYIYTTRSSIVLVDRQLQLTAPVKCTLIRVDNAYEAIARLLQLYEQMKTPRTGVHPQAYVASTAVVADDCYIGPFAYVGEGATVGRSTQIYPHAVVEAGVHIGENCIIYPHVSVYHDCHIGNRCILHSGCVIGADGFGFAPSEEGYVKIPQIGNVVIEDDVEIGANACIDRSTMGSTRIEHGVKIDNLVQVAHNCVVGANSVMSAQVGVAGSTTIGSWCMFGGQVGVAGHSAIADHTHVGAQTGIPGNVRRPGTTLQGSPAIEAKNFARSSVLFKQLPELAARIARIEEQLRSSQQ